MLQAMINFSTIVWIDVILSGDNALVIALVCKRLSPVQRQLGIILGSGGAILARLLLLLVTTEILTFPGAKLIGGLFLIYVALKMVQDSDEEAEVRPRESLLAAIGTIAVADVMMSTDNVVAVAAAARGNYTLIVIGMLISIPLMIIGASLISALITKFPVLLYFGAGVLLYIAGTTIVADPIF